ncbi:uncharacterized protein EAE98_005366 [Botrytis deweyae]|uniref:Uncharacterized protein n=1 Tax=Botrytis deweyae TaxID=2478750 RepID=A0ABQ7IP61_9HELO|nr:uncharacterized protein EAE98_005366 [Botrytis deweyae]KAF7929448.1 hypothetical protein EAE98_005366 [Botrytis deweyae]
MMKKGREFSKPTAPWTVVIEIHTADSACWDDAGTGNWSHGHWKKEAREGREAQFTDATFVFSIRIPRFIKR